MESYYQDSAGGFNYYYPFSTKPHHRHNFHSKTYSPPLEIVAYFRFLTHYTIWISHHPIPIVPLFILRIRCPTSCPRPSTNGKYCMDTNFTNSYRRMCVTYRCIGSYSYGCVIWIWLDLCFVGNISCA